MIYVGLHFCDTLLLSSCDVVFGFDFKVQCIPLNSNSRRPTRFVLIMKCSNYEFASNIKCKYNGISRDHNHLTTLTGYLNKQSLN